MNHLGYLVDITPVPKMSSAIIDNEFFFVFINFSVVELDAILANVKIMCEYKENKNIYFATSDTNVRVRARVCIRLSGSVILLALLMIS